MNNIPEGFETLQRSSPYLDLLAPIYSKAIGSGVVIGFRAQEKHCNSRGLVHGGVFSTLADTALGYNAAFSNATPVPLVTASLTIDYAGSAKIGDWIELECDVQKMGRSMAFANCYFICNDKRIVRASGVFKVI